MKPWERYAGADGPWAKYTDGAPPTDVGAAFARGEANTMIPGTPPQPKPAPEPGMVDTMLGGGLEAAGSMATAIPARLIGNSAGAVRRFLPGGDMNNASEMADRITDQLTYRPREESGRRALQTVGDIMSASKLEGLNPAMGAEVSAPGAAAKGVRDAGRGAAARAGQVVDELPVGDLPKSMAPPAAAMPGVGAAETAGEIARRERASSLPAPISLTKGQASRDFEQQRFERETAKDVKLGKPIRERYAEQNEQILQNFDAWVDQSGAQAPSLRATGKAVDEALVKDAGRAKAKINSAYDRARDAGEMEAPVKTEGVRKYLEENAAAEGTSKILGAARSELERLEKLHGGKGEISVNDMERLRQFVNENSQMGSPDMVHAPKLRQAIDDATEGVGGKLYGEARTLRKNFARKFEDHAVVAKLLRTKPGTKDRTVALEDVFKHSVLDSSLDDLQSFGRVVKAAGPEGRQAWSEIQGATVQYIRDEATKGITRDIRGNPIASPSAIYKNVRELDRDGKLDYLFGKANAEHLRDIADIAIDVHTAPPGAVNASTSGAVILGALREIGTGHFSVGTAKALAVLKQELGMRAQKKRVRDALEEPAAP